MKKDIMLPQGKFKIGRDLDAGIYLIAGLNDLTFVTVTNNDDEEDLYTLNDDNSKMVHIELEKGYILEIEGLVKIRFIKRTIDFNLFEEIEQFENDLGKPSAKKKTSNPIIIKDDEDDSNDGALDDKEGTIEKVKSRKKKIGFWKALGMLFATSSDASTSTTSDSSSSFWSSPKKKNTGRCDGDCANCPPHYGYRYGRWYYGKDHTEGCTRGGNRGGGGII